MTQPLPSLLDSMLAEEPPRPARAPLRARAAAPFRRAWTRLTATPARRARVLLAARLIGAGALVGAGAAAYLVFRPAPMPDYASDDLDSVLGYTLLTDEFNRLPVEERLRLIGQLIQRFKSLDTGESVLLANFAAGIAGTARDQMFENASRLAIDTWDKYAMEYEQVPPADEEEYLDRAFVEFTKMMEGVGGQVRDISDEERLAEGRRQAARDMERMRDPNRGPSNEALARMFRVMNEDVGHRASGHQRVRGAQLMRDMTRRLRAQDIRTGKPK